MKDLSKRLNLYGLTMIAVGSCIGAGIFVTPYVVAQSVPHAGYLLVVWSLGGLVALTGALTFAELGGLFPKAGGVYVFLREAFGPLVAFLYGWVILLAVNTGALAALGIALADYLTYFFPLSGNAKVAVAILVIILLTLTNVKGVATSQLLVNLLTGLKLAAIVGIIALGLFAQPVDTPEVVWSLTTDPPPHLGAALLLGLVGVLWSFGGWHHASYLAGETRDASRNVPRAMLLGTLIVTIAYVAINYAYLSLMSVDELAASTRVAGDAVGKLFSGGGRFAALVITISITGTIAIYTMSAPRIYFAMAQDGVFFPQLARVHAKYKTPLAAMLVQAGWAIVLLLFWGTFEGLITYTTLVDIVFMGMAASSIFVFRKKLPDAHRPYRAWGYPLIPLLFIGICTAFVLSTLINRPKYAIAGLILLALGIVAYKFFKRRNNPPVI